jgi:hypothetical protein
MATAQEVREEVRVTIGDDDSDNETYTDGQLNIFIRAALKRLKNRVALGITITLGSFSTEPTDCQADLISLQVQCMINQRDLKRGIDDGIRTRQDQSEVDTIGALNSHSQSALGKFSACETLEGAIADYIENNPDLDIPSVASTHGKNIWAGNRKLYEDVDYEGTGSDRLWSTQPGNRRRRRNGRYGGRFLGGNE